MESVNKWLIEVRLENFEEVEKDEKKVDLCLGGSS